MHWYFARDHYRSVVPKIGDEKSLPLWAVSLSQAIVCIKSETILPLTYKNADIRKPIPTEKEMLKKTMLRSPIVSSIIDMLARHPIRTRQRQQLNCHDKCSKKLGRFRNFFSLKQYSFRTVSIWVGLWTWYLMRQKAVNPKNEIAERMDINWMFWLSMVWTEENLVRIATMHAQVP